MQVMVPTNRSQCMVLCAFCVFPSLLPGQSELKLETGFRHTMLPCSLPHLTDNQMLYAVGGNIQNIFDYLS